MGRAVIGVLATSLNVLQCQEILRNNFITVNIQFCVSILWVISNSNTRKNIVKDSGIRNVLQNIKFQFQPLLIVITFVIIFKF